jgi:outer membrane protein insertion porin family/translocation and assembly module TamA
VLFLVPTGIDCARKGDERAPGCIRPIGGVTLWEASFEIRFPISGPLTMVTFADASNVTRQVGVFDFNVPHLSVGPGLRYDTPVGPLRVDIGYRIPGMQRVGDKNLPEKDGVASPFLGISGLDIAVHLAFGEAF